MFVLLQIQKKAEHDGYLCSYKDQHMKNTEGNGVAKGASSPRRDIFINVSIIKMFYFSSL